MAETIVMAAGFDNITLASQLYVRVSKGFHHIDEIYIISIYAMSLTP